MSIEEEQEETDYNFPEQPAQPAPNALLNDWRFEACYLTMSNSGEIFSTIDLNNNFKAKGKKQKHHVSFALCIPTPPDVETITGDFIQ